MGKRDDLRLTTVAVTAGMLPAQVLKGKLELAGIPVLLRYESAGLVYGITVDGLGRVEVQVPGRYVEDARAILSEVPEEGDGPDEAVSEEP